MALHFIASINTHIYGVRYDQGEEVDITDWSRKQILQFLGMGLIAPSQITTEDVASVPQVIDWLDDVDTSTTAPLTGQVLEFSSGQWRPADSSSGATGPTGPTGATGATGAAGPSAVSTSLDFTDQGSDATTPASSHHVVYAKSGGVYVRDAAGTVAGPIGAGGASNLDALTDVDTTTTPPTNTQVLTYQASSGQWKPSGYTPATTLNNTVSPSGNVLVVTGLAETLLPGCDLTLAGTSIVISWTAWISQSAFGVAKQATIRLRRTSISGAILASAVIGDSGDSGGGHQASWISSFTDSSPTNGHYVMTVQETAGNSATQIYSDTRTFSLSAAAIGTPPISTLDSLTDVDTSTVAPTTGQALVFDATSSLWKPGSVASGGGGGGGGTTPSAFGTIGAETGVGVKTLYLTVSGMTAVSATRLQVDTAGTYLIHAQQLVQNGGAVYWHIQKNGTSLAHAYSPGSFDDKVVTVLAVCAVNDYVEVYQQNAVSNAWSGLHSSFAMHKI